MIRHSYLFSYTTTRRTGHVDISFELKILPCDLKNIIDTISDLCDGEPVVITSIFYFGEVNDDSDNCTSAIAMEVKK